MTSLEMLREFKVGMDKIDSQSYPEIYDEQIYMFINKAIDMVVNAGRKVFEENQTITDNLKSLIPKVPVKILPTAPAEGDVEYLFDLVGIDYLFYIRSSANVKVTINGEVKKGVAYVRVTQHDDIEVVLYDPYNKPAPHRVPVTFSRDTITAYTDGIFEIEYMTLVYVKKPAVVSVTVNCDLDKQIHYTIVDAAIKLAEASLGLLPATKTKKTK